MLEQNRSPIVQLDPIHVGDTVTEQVSPRGIGQRDDQRFQLPNCPSAANWPDSDRSFTPSLSAAIFA